MNKSNIALFFSVVLLANPAYAADIVKGKTQFGERCASCHGVMGAGDGPIAAALPADSKPANLATSTYKFATDEAKFKELLQKGGAGVGLNPLMTGAPGATDEEIANIYAFVQSLRK